MVAFVYNHGAQYSIYVSILIKTELDLKHTNTILLMESHIYIYICVCVCVCVDSIYKTRGETTLHGVSRGISELNLNFDLTIIYWVISVAI